MQVVACDAPIGPIEPAPLTSLLLEQAENEATLSAFWSSDDRYYVRSESGSGALTPATTWYCIDDADGLPGSAVTAQDPALAAIARQFLDVIPMGGGRVAFPVGSTGRTVYRVWRSKGGQAGQDRTAGRTRILGVRAGRSLRRPA